MVVISAPESALDALVGGKPDLVFEPAQISAAETVALSLSSFTNRHLGLLEKISLFCSLSSAAEKHHFVVIQPQPQIEGLQRVMKLQSGLI